MKKWLLLLLVLVAGPAWGQEFSALGGMIQETEKSSRTATYQFEYANTITGPFAYSVSYLNEGHFTEHHRDGVLAQLWWKYPVKVSELYLIGGGGPYVYFDTNERNRQTIFRNEHGIGGVFTLGAQWRVRKPLILHLRTNWIVTESDWDTISVLFGVGVELDRTPDRTGGRSDTDLESNRNAVTLYLGQTISNNNDPKNAVAWGVEYSRSFGKYLTGTVLWLDEGDNDSFHRRGIASQLWVGDSFYSGRLSLAIGFGPYVAWNAYRDRLTGKDGTIAAGLLSLGAGYRLGPNWELRGVWHRVVTDYDRDCDVLLAGIGFRF